MTDNKDMQKKDLQDDTLSHESVSFEAGEELYAEELGEQHDMANPNGSTLGSLSSVSCFGSTASTVGSLSTGATVG